MSTITLYGPIGRAVEKVSPYVECDPVGIYVAALSMWSAAIGQTVKVSSRGNARPALVWSALVGGTGKGKGTALRAAQHIMKPALGRFLETHTTSGITSGASLVNHLAEQVEATEETEAGRDVRALVIEEEWSETLRRVRRDASFTAKLRSAWDGAPIRNTTKAEAQSVDDPALVMHTHITPSDWTKYIGATEAAGGSYNRIMPFTLGAVPMLDDDGATLPEVDGWDITQAYYWAAGDRHTVSLGEDARSLWKVIRRYARIISESLPEAQAVYVERTAEQTIRVAACLAASERCDVIDRTCLSAAFSLVRYSVRCAVSITGGTESAKPARRVPTLAEKVRARIEMNGGKARSSDLLPYVGASADEVKALPGVKVTLDRSGLGRPATVYTLAEEEAGHAPLSRPRTQRDERPATVVRMDTYRPAKTTPPAPVPAPRPEPVVTGNPFLALL
ncbi:YfjI family protein [Kitasatospora purpeofusca]|uniref:DUF3987 domain-containing protein n=1 Tax=Kitasatospora purpeofusca TaxID=67352 RepID=UPI00224E3BB7|nr:DUF3987 domain-containing protein [Kitasatospora purpeofusca]MCX4684692.1 YfjI family protein [Kitasatospora purpeofusca]